MIYVPEVDEPIFDEPELFDMEEPDDYIVVDELDFSNSKAFDSRLHSAPSSNTEDSEADAMFESISIPSYQDKKENKQQTKKTYKKEDTKTQKKTVSNDSKKEWENPESKGSSVVKENITASESKVDETQKNENVVQPKIKVCPIPNIDETISEKKDSKELEFSDLEDTDVEDCTFNFENGAFPDIETETEEAIITDPEGNSYVSTFTEVSVNDDDFSDTFDYDLDEDSETTDENKGLKFLSLKKLICAAAMLGIVIGIPFLMTFMENKEKQPYTVTVNTIETTETISDTSAVFVKTEEEVFGMSSSETATSTRFETLDDLTLYLASNQGSTLSAEKQLVTRLNNGTVSYGDFVEQMNEHIVFTDSLNHLLISNRETYRNAGLEDTYNELVANSNALIVYGDKALYEANSEQSTALK